ncbi:MAG: hypothetical protein J5850_03855 [Clostridia bacterium]|nr:hypothetical protein [Clostridia bacterium]
MINDEKTQIPEEEKIVGDKAPLKAEKEDLAEKILADESEEKRKQDEHKAEIEDEIEKYKREIEELKAGIEKENARQKDLSLLAELYPGLSVDDIPSSVIEASKASGIPLAAEYALFLRREQLEKEKNLGKTLADIESQSGDIGSYGERESYFTIERIKTMSPKEIGKNYKAVIRSLTKMKSYK